MRAMNEFDINDLIDNAIESLSSDTMNSGAEELAELAEVWHRAGLPVESFEDIRGHIVQAAEQQTDAYFIREKLVLAERKLRDTRYFSMGK